jgi:large subunit ribosomal protein L29
MAIIRKSEIKQMNRTALQEKLLDLKKELIKLNAQIAIGTLPENPGRVREVKRTIAKIKTFLKQKPKEEIKK